MENGHAKRYSGTIDAKDVLAMLREGKYRVDTENGIVYGRGGRPISVSRDEHRKGKHVYCSVRLYQGKRRVGIGLARLVWMARLGRDIPAEFEIHHRDENGENSCWGNLLCLHKEDHKKLHEGEEEVPF